MRAEEGGGAILIACGHGLDVVRWYLGAVAEVNGQVQTLGQETRFSDTGEVVPVDAIDTAACMTRLANGGHTAPDRESGLASGAVVAAVYPVVAHGYTLPAALRRRGQPAPDARSRRALFGNRSLGGGRLGPSRTDRAGMQGGRVVQ
jgi:hypothetical protein